MEVEFKSARAEHCLAFAVLFFFSRLPLSRNACFQQRSDRYRYRYLRQDNCDMTSNPPVRSE